MCFEIDNRIKIELVRMIFYWFNLDHVYEMDVYELKEITNTEESIKKDSISSAKVEKWYTRLFKVFCK